MKKALLDRPITMSVEDLGKASATLVENALAMYPDLPAAMIVPKLLEMADDDFLAALDGALRGSHFLRLLRTQRAKRKRLERDSGWLLPEIREHVLALPVRVPIGDGVTIPRHELRYEHTNLYLKFLKADENSRKENDPRRAAIAAIQKLWPRSKKRPRQMTLAEVDAVKAAK